MDSGVLTLLVVVAVAYLLAHLLTRRLQSRFLITTRGEYLLLGVLLGPANPFFQVFDADVLRQLGPLMSLAIGWVGLLYGMHLDLRRALFSRSGGMKLAGLSSALTLPLVMLASLAAFQRVEALAARPDAQLLASLVLGAVAAVASPAVVDLVRRSWGADGPTTTLLGEATRLEELIAAVIFGLVFCFFRAVDGGVTLQADQAAEWILATFVLGGVLGLLFRLFLGDEADPDKQFLALVGIIVFSSGAAHYLQLSPILVNLVLGVVLANVAEDSEVILRVLERTRQPMYVVLLLFAGGLWVLPSGGWLPWAFAAAFVCLRAAGKLGGGWLGAMAMGRGLRRDVGRGLLGQGEIAVAMALNFKLVYASPLTDLVFTAALFSVVANELWSGRLLKNLLIDCGDIKSQRRAEEG